MDSYSRADPEVQVLQIANPSNRISSRSRSRKISSPLLISKGVDQEANGSVGNISFLSMNKADNRSFSSKKLPAIVEYEKQKMRSGNESGKITEDSPWTKFSQTITCCCFPMLLSTFGMKGYYVQQAWREKVALCFIILCVMALVAYFTVGMRSNLCPSDPIPGSPYFLPNGGIPYREDISIMGLTYNFQDMVRLLASLSTPINLTSDWYGQDLSKLFDLSQGACSSFIANPATFCAISNPIQGSPNLTVPNCLSPSILNSISPTSILTADWSDLSRIGTYYVYSGKFMDLKAFFSYDQPNDFVNIPSISRLIPGTDSTLSLNYNSKTSAFGQCLASRYTKARLGSSSIGCSVYTGLMIAALVTVMGVIITRFLMALLFHWIIAPRISSLTNLESSKNDVGYLSNPTNSRYFVQKDLPGDNGPLYKQGWKRSLALPTDLYTICLVTCYSEDEDAIRGTLDSIAGSDYPDDRKLLFVICDGLIHGAGNRYSTPDIVISMIEQDPKAKAIPVSYLAIADGVKQHNMAKVYAGQYYYRQRPVPIILVVKCGTEEERTANSQEELTKKKAGNRGKRDSQLILMQFLSRVNFDDRMTELDYDIFWKIQKITGGITADYYQLLLMVDADTVINSISLRYMVQTMVNDPKVMGLCGETRISNKMQSWVTMIQVYEYFTSHNLGKAFESVFGGVTCLPGCFCMYRIKATTEKKDQFVPLLVNPDIVACYSENIVDTLHKKNLLLLGEDRFLSTLMLGSFPKRKMVYVPHAICHTTVPHTYKILQSQRRRWINSTIHNLLELVLLPTLCGTFCLSMQFVIGLELFGTVSLPIAIILTFFLLFSSATSASNNFLPLMLLVLVLLLPGILVLITTKKPVYVLWMFVYLLALPVWNLFLPLYAFWHFDDFSWGDTRIVQGEKKQEDHSKRQGEYKIGSVRLQRWEEWELARRMEQSLPSIPESQLDYKDQSVSQATSLPKKVHDDHKWQITDIKKHSMDGNVINQFQVKSRSNPSLSGPNVTEDLHYYQHSIDRPQTSFKIAEAHNVEKLVDQTQIEKDLGIPPRRTSISSSISDKINLNVNTSIAVRQSSSSINPTATIQPAVIKKPNETAQFGNVSTNLPVKPGNTINQFWKSMYMVQLDEISNQLSVNDVSRQDNERKDPTNFIEFKPHSTSTLRKKKQDPPHASVVSHMNHSLDTSVSTKLKFINKNAEGSELTRHDTIESIASYMTAPPYIENESLNNHHRREETVDDFHSVASYSTTRSSMVQGSRPAPWQDSASTLDAVTGSDSLALKNGEVFQFNIEREAKTSTTTKAWKELMRKASQVSHLSSQDPNVSSNLSNFAKKMQNYWQSDSSSSIVDDPMKSYLTQSRPVLIREVSKVDISIDRVGSLSKSKVLGAREFPQELPIHSRSSTSSTSRNLIEKVVHEDSTVSAMREITSKVKGSRPLPADMYLEK